MGNKKGRLQRREDQNAGKHYKSATAGKDCEKTLDCSLFAGHEGPCALRK